MIDLLQIVASIGGVGAVFGIVVFFIYRIDRKNSENKLREDRKFMEDRLTNVLDNYSEAFENNAKALTELIVLLRSMNGKGK